MQMFGDLCDELRKKDYNVMELIEVQLDEVYDIQLTQEQLKKGYKAEYELKQEKEIRTKEDK